jgi:hypothetical protein
LREIREKAHSSTSGRVRKTIWEDPSISAKFFPYLKDETAWIIHKSSDQSEIEIGDNGLPFPPLCRLCFYSYF